MRLAETQSAKLQKIRGKFYYSLQGHASHTKEGQIGDIRTFRLQSETRRLGKMTAMRLFTVQQVWNEFG